MYFRDSINKTCWKNGKDLSNGAPNIKLWNHAKKNTFSSFCQKFPQAMDEVENFFCQFPNPWTLRVSGTGCYTSKCEKKSKSLHPTVQTGQELMRSLSIRVRNWCVPWAYALGFYAYAQHKHKNSKFERGPYKPCWAYTKGTGAHAEHTGQELMCMLSISISSLRVRSACALETKLQLSSHKN